MPAVKRVADTSKGGYTFDEDGRGYVVIEAEHFYKACDGDSVQWTVIPDMGRTLSGISAMPYTAPLDGASLSYRMKLPSGTSKAAVTVVVKSTLAFKNRDGHRYEVDFGADGQNAIFRHIFRKTAFYQCLFHSIGLIGPIG